MTWTNRTGATVPEEDILRDVAAAEYDGIPLPRSDPRPLTELQDTLANHGLRVAPGYLGGRFWDAEHLDPLVDEARTLSRKLREAGCSELFVAAGGGYFTADRRMRRDIAGRVGPDDGLTEEEYDQFAGALDLVARAAADEGIRICLHNHVGSVIETRREMEELLARTDPARVFLGPDTGHLVWAGDDAVAFCRDYADRIRGIHLKDIDPAVAQRGRAGKWDYPTFKNGGIFAELGEGCIDFAAILHALKSSGYMGWLIVETDFTMKATALESATISRSHLRNIGN
jgi:inosose dehydratase